MVASSTSKPLEIWDETFSNVILLDNYFSTKFEIIFRFHEKWFFRNQPRSPARSTGIGNTKKLWKKNKYAVKSSGDFED